MTRDHRETLAEIARTMAERGDAQVLTTSVPVVDHRHQVEMIWTVRGEWAGLLSVGATITIRPKEPAA